MQKQKPANSPSSDYVCRGAPNQEARILDIAVYPNEFSPNTISCLQGGGSPHCADRNDRISGACDEMCFWVDQYNCASEECPNGVMIPGLDTRGPLGRSGQCFDWDSNFYSDLTGSPDSARGWHIGGGSSRVISNSGFNQNEVAIQYYDDRGCRLDSQRLNGQYIPVIFTAQNCFTGDGTCDSDADTSTVKVLTCEASCGADGFGCVLQYGNLGIDAFGVALLSHVLDPKLV